MPQTFAEYIATFAGHHVRILLSSGERRDGVLVVHDDFVTFEDVYGGFAIAHIAGIVPLPPSTADAPPPRHADPGETAREHPKKQ